MNERELREILSLNIKEYRNHCNLSQMDLAQKLGISVNFLCNIEQGKKWVSPQTLIKFATALNIQPYQLFMPKDALPPDVTTILNKYADEAVVAVAQTLNNIRGYYLTQTNVPLQN
jgi:transcriptional regulator with XRE-family HTH domain